MLGVLGLHLRRARASPSTRPSGTVEGTTFLGIEGNGWTWVAFAAAGLLLLLGSPIHWGAKSMAFIVGVTFLVGALIALSDGTDILGIIATNNWTKLVMGAAGAALILLSMMPRVGRRRGGAPVATRRDRDRDRELDDPAERRFDREREPATNGRATTTRPTARSRTAATTAPRRSRARPRRASAAGRSPSGTTSPRRRSTAPGRCRPGS